MPTYDYRCPAGHDFERFYRKISDAPAEHECPVCGAVAVRRVSGGAGLLFRGSGFYLTDYGKNAHRKPAPDGPKADGKGGEKGGDRGGEKGGDSAAAGTDSSGAAASSGAADGKPKSETKPAPSKPTGQSGGE